MDILEILNTRRGQTQEERLPPELERHFADIEERGTQELYEFVKRFAAQIRYYEAGTGAVIENGDWSSFFPGERPARTRDGRTPPHLALLAAFLKLYRIPRCAMNGYTARHLDFFYQRVLGFTKLPPRADRAHVLVELKKGAVPVEIGPQHAFSAGKDAEGVELVYAPSGRTVVNGAKVEKLHSIFLDEAGGGTVRFAPEARTGDGFGAALPKEEPRWPPFGMPRNPAIAAAPIGFAVSSPMLRMKEGTRAVTLTLRLEAVPATLTGEMLSERLEAFLTGPKRWLGPYPLTVTLAGGTLSAKLTIPADEEAIADYDPARHQHAFAARAPVIQVLLRDDVPHGYRELRNIVVTEATIEVAATGLKSLLLENDSGSLDPRRAFQPFGAQPVPGSRFMVGCAEALSKPLAELTLDLQWLGLPASFAALYSGYGVQRNEADFTVSVALRDAAGHEIPAEAGFPLFQPRVNGTVSLAIRPGTGLSAAAQPQALIARRIDALAAGGSTFVRNAARREWLKRPVLGFGSPAAPAARQGYVTLSLLTDFLHAEYRAILLRTARAVAEPYTPTLREIALSYRTLPETARIDSAREEDFAGTGLAFFHVGAFGQRREHAWLRSRFPFVDDRRVPLFPAFEDQGELLIGLSALGGGDSVSLLVKVAEGSADPEVDDPPAVRWSALCDNYWKPLQGRDAVRDGTGNFLASGIVGVTIPTEATTLNSWLPSGFVWLRAAVRRDALAVCSLLQVAANGLEVERSSGGGAAARLWTPLPAGRIARLKTPIAAVKTVAQPYASFGGAAPESGDALNTRAAERLRHRNRCITAWDYERLVLGAFPEVRKVKCIPHSAGHGAWLNPGHVHLVVVPDLRNRHAVDPLQPRADAGTLARVEQHVRERSPMHIDIQARNPRYERIRVDFKVRFRPGLEFNFYARELRRKLVEHLAPWAHDPRLGVSFGGVIYKSALIDFVEEDESVDYVTDFRMHHLRGAPGDGADVNEARASTPDAILVSDASHDIEPVTAAVPA